MKKLFQAAIIALLASLLSAYFISRVHAATVNTNDIHTAVRLNLE